MNLEEESFLNKKRRFHKKMNFEEESFWIKWIKKKKISYRNKFIRKRVQKEINLEKEELRKKWIKRRNSEMKRFKRERFRKRNIFQRRMV